MRGYEMYLTQDDLQRMMDVDIKTVELETLTDLNNITIDTKKSVTEKLSQLASQTDNLFVNRVGEYIVKVSYAKTNMTINDKFKNYISRLAEVNY